MTEADSAALEAEELLRQEISTEIVMSKGAQLVDANQRYLGVVKELVKAGDKTKLSDLVHGDLAAHRVLEAYGSHSRVPALTGDPYSQHDGLLVHSGRALASLGLVLVDAENAISHLEVFRRWLNQSGLHVPSGVVHEVSKDTPSDHRKVLEHLAAAGELDPLVLTWLLELEGALHTEATKVQTGPAVQVLLDFSQHGQRAEVHLSYRRDLPAGLIPDPSKMALASFDEQFQAALNSAWQLAGGKLSHAVFWSVVDSAGPVNRIGGPSLGAAFTVLLNEHARLSRRIWGPLTASRLQPGNAIVGAVDATQPTAILGVGGYAQKLSVVTDKMRVVLPRSDIEKALAATSGVAELHPVDSWPEAAKKARGWARRRVLTIFSVVVLVIASAAVAAWGVTASGRDADQRRAESSSLAAQAVGLRRTDPILAARIALAAHEIDSSNGRVVDALRELVTQRRNVQRAWQADKSRVDAIAVSEEIGRVVTSGSDGKTKVWRDDTTLVGEIPRRSLRLVTSQSKGLAAALTESGLALYDIGGNTPVELAAMSKPSCSKEYFAQIADLEFTGQDSTLVAVWHDGAISTYDIVTRKELTCSPATEALSPLPIAGQGASRAVLAADVVAAPPGKLEVVLLLSSNEVATVRKPGGQAEITLSAADIAGSPMRVAASDSAIAVATDQGVAVWSREDKRLLANPAGGLRAKPTTIQFSKEHLLIAGAEGTALVPVGNPEWMMPRTLSELNGGEATVAAIDARSVVAGGPRGWVWMIGDTTAGIQLDQPVFSTDVDFLPDGRLVGSSVPAWSGLPPQSIGTNSRGLFLLDPKRPPALKLGQNSIPPTYTYGKQDSFYANEIAAVPGLFAASGLVGREGTILVWSDKDGTDSPFRLTFETPQQKNADPIERIVASVGITPDGTILAARSVSGRLGIWSAASWKSVAEVEFKPGNPRIVVAQNHVFLVDGVDEGAELVRVDLLSGAETRRVPLPNADHISASADGSTVVAMTKTAQVQRYDVNLEAVGEPWSPATSGMQVDTMVVNPAGRRVAVGQGDKVLIYELDSRLLALPELEVDGRVSKVAWSPDGEMLAGVSAPPERGRKQVNPVRSWRVGELDWTAQVCGWTSRGLNTEEWRRYVGDDRPYVDTCGGER